MAQETEKPSRELSYWKGDNLFYVGITPLNFGWGYLGNRSISIPPVFAAFEMGFHEYISVGGFVGIGRWKYDHGAYNSDYYYTHYSFGIKGSFHFLTMLNEELDADIDDSDLDLYITMHVGPQIQVGRWEDESVANSDLDNDFDFHLFRPVLGIRYELSEQFGVFFEAGRGTFGWGTIGLAGKL